LAEQEKKAGRLDVQVTSDIGACELPPALCEEAYRIVVETLQCATLDPAGSCVKVDLAATPQSLRIQLAWNGDPRIKSSSIDPLRLIKHRVQGLRGTLKCEPLGSAVCCLATIPLNAATEGERNAGAASNQDVEGDLLQVVNSLRESLK
jgi:hypothetical protein